MPATQVTGKFTITDHDYFVREHTVDGIHIMPGVTFLDMIFKTLKASSFAPEKIELRHIMFLEPVVTTAAFDRKVEIHITTSEDAWTVEARSTKWKDGKLVDPTITKHLTCQLFTLELPPQLPLDIVALKDKAERVVDLDACYSMTRQVGINHDNFMKCTGKVYENSYGCLGEVYLSAIASSYNQDFILHPVFLDCSTIVPLYYSIPARERAQLYVPFYIESFSGKSLTGRNNCYIYVEKPAQAELTEEIGYRSFVICDEYGNRLATFRNFGVKRVHNIELIRRYTKLNLKAQTNIVTIPQQQEKQLLPTQKPTVAHLVAIIKNIISKHTQQDFSSELAEVSFFELGLDSTALLEIAHNLEALLQIRLYPTILFEQPTITKLAEFLWNEHSESVHEYLCQQLGNAESFVLQTDIPNQSKAEHLFLPKKPSQQEQLVVLIKQLLSKYLPQDFANELLEASFFELGLDSTALLEIAHNLEALLQIRLYPTMLFEQPTIAKLAEFLHREYGEAVSKYFSSHSISTQTIIPETALSQPKILEIEDKDSENIHHVSSPSQSQEIIFIPKWQPVNLPISNPKASENLASKSLEQGKTLIVSLGASQNILQLLLSLHKVNDSYLIIVGDSYQDWQNGAAAIRREQADDWERIISELTQINKVYFIVDSSNISEGSNGTVQQEYSHTSAFRFIKAIIGAKLTSKQIEFNIITFNSVQVLPNEQFQPYDNGLYGIWKSFSREYNHCTVTCWDLAKHEVEASFLQGDIFWLQNLLQNQDLSGNTLAVRKQQLYRQQLYSLPAANTEESKFKPNGTYLIIGGTGGIGIALSSYLRSKYSANIALVGRSLANDQIFSKISALGKYGREVIYIQAHCDDVNQLSSALAQAKQIFGKIDGIIHSAMVLDDCLLANMSEQSFAKVLQPKVAGTLALDQVTRHEQLDFILFFSSLQSFVGNLGQGNYATASTFLDSYARHMAQHRSYPVSVVNWGYWGDIGAVANEKYRDLMLRQGMHSLGIDEAMAALETVLSRQSLQAIVVKANTDVLVQIGLVPDVLGEDNQTLEISLEGDNFFAAYYHTLTGFKNDMNLLMHYAAAAVVEILQNLGLYRNLGEAYNLSEAIKVAKIASEHENLFAEIMNFLVREGYLSRQKDNFYATEKVQYFSGDRTLTNFEQQAAKIIHGQPELKNFSRLLWHCLKSYPEILQGKIPATSALFPNSSVELVEGVYSGNIISDVYNELVAYALVNQIKSTFKDVALPEKIKVLEIGAGSGGTTRKVLALLSKHNISVEYKYTDLWIKLLEHGKEKFGKFYPGMSFSVLDISIDPEKQGLKEQFDFVIATNILHATANIGVSIENVKKLLKPTGCLILNESVKLQDFSTLTFGLLRGWWNSQDQHLRYPGSPLLKEDTWKQVFQEKGFGDLELLVPTSTDDNNVLVQQVFVVKNGTEIAKPYAVNTTSVKPNVELSLVSNSEHHIDAVNFQKQLKKADLHSLYGCHRREFTCLHSYIDPNNCLWLFLNSPNGNALSIQLLDELLDVIEALSQPKQLFDMPKIIYISHHGKYFSLGGDRTLLLEYMRRNNPEILKNFATKVKQVIHGVVSLDALVVTVVHGAAQGGGFEMLMCSDFQFLHSDVKLGLPEVKSGLIPGMGGMSFLKQQIGLLRTKQLVLTGELIAAPEAQEIGLISHVSNDPFIDALRFYKTIDNFETALYLKKYLDHGKGWTLTQDIDTWFEYLVNHRDWVNERRITASLKIINQ